MTGVVEMVRSMVENTCVISKGLRKEGCTVSLKDVPQSRLIIDFDKPGSPLGKNQARCDYLCVAEVAGKPGWVVPLELKRGGIDASKVVRQLNAGARAAKRLVPNTMKVNFRPVVAYGGGIHTAERNALRANHNKVQFHGTAEPVRLIKCRGQLIEGIKP